MSQSMSNKCEAPESLRQFSTPDLRNLHELYMTLGLVPTGFKDFLVFSAILLDSTRWAEVFAQNIA